MTTSAKILGFLALAGLSACTAGPPPVAGAGPVLGGDRLTVSVGPCFGFCPVYEASLTPDGAVVFDGKRNTAVLGERRRNAGAAVYRQLAADLGRFRPADGTTAAVECDAAISDTSPYVVTWTTADGRKTVAELQSGCPSGPGHDLSLILNKLPERLGIADWARQTTRPGQSRG